MKEYKLDNIVDSEASLVEDNGEVLRLYPDYMEYEWDYILDVPETKMEIPGLTEQVKYCGIQSMARKSLIGVSATWDDERELWLLDIYGTGSLLTIYFDNRKGAEILRKVILEWLLQ